MKTLAVAIVIAIAWGFSPVTIFQTIDAGLDFSIAWTLVSMIYD
mgnify:CR=1 FL=1